MNANTKQRTHIDPGAFEDAMIFLQGPDLFSTMVPEISAFLDRERPIGSEQIE